MATKVLSVLGPDYCLVRTRTAILLAMVAANCGRRVLVTQAGDSESGLALTLPANLARQEAPNRFVVAGIPAESLQIILPAHAQESASQIAEKFARQQDLIICCCDDERNLPKATDAKLLVAGHDGLMLEEAAAIHKRHPDATVVVATALPNDFSRKFCLVRSSAILPQITKETISLPAGGRELVPSSVEDSPELWHNSQLLLDALFPEENIALGKTVKYGNEIVRADRATRQEVDPSQEIVVPDNDRKPAADAADDSSAKSEKKRKKKSSGEAKAKQAATPESASAAKQDTATAAEHEQQQPDSCAQQLAKDDAKDKASSSDAGANKPETPESKDSAAENDTKPAAATDNQDDATDTEPEAAVSDKEDADAGADKFKAPKLAIQKDEEDKASDRQSKRKSLEKPNLTIGLIDYEAAYNIFVPDVVLDKQAVVAQNKMNVKVPYAPSPENLTKGFGELISSVKRIPDGTYGQERRLCCGYLALKWAKYADELHMPVLEKSLREFATVQFSLVGKQNLFPWLLAALWTAEIQMVEGKHEHIEKSLTDITKRVTEISADDYEESARSLIPAMLAVVLCKAARLSNNEQGASGFEDYADKHIKKLIPAHAKIINLEMLDSDNDDKWQNKPQGSGISDQQVSEKVGKAKDSFGAMAN